MISIEECKKYLGDIELPDEKIEELRDILYNFGDQALDYVIQSGTLVPSKDLCGKFKPIIVKEH